MEEIAYVHPALEDILQPTYGCIVYQEQVMKIVRKLAGYSLARSDLVRRAMSKKKADVMAQERTHFLDGCAERGIPESAAVQIFDDMADFARYAFPQPHAAAYAMIGYQTAWLKNYYPVEFMAAIMTSVMDFTLKVVEYIQVCRKMDIKVLPPDINEGFRNFSVSGDAIRFGLSAIKNVGRGAIDALVAERENGGAFKSLTDFIRRMKDNANKRFVEGLIKAGAFDSLGGKRVQYMAVYKGIMDGAAQSRRQTFDGQVSLFEMDGQEAPDDTDVLPALQEYDQRTLLNAEKEALGLYISGHPLRSYEDVLGRYTNCTSLSVASAKDGQKAAFGGMVAARSIKYTRASGKPMAFVTLEDVYGQVEVIVFSQLYEKLGARLLADQVVVINGHVSLREDEEPKLIADDIKFYDELAPPSKTFWVKIPREHQVEMQVVTNILHEFPGDTQVKIYDEGRRQRFVSASGIKPCQSLFDNLENVLGAGTVKLV